MEAIDAIEYIWKSMNYCEVPWYRSTSEGLADYLHLVAVQIPGATMEDLATVSKRAQFENALISEFGYDGVFKLTASQIADLYAEFDPTGTRIVKGIRGIYFMSNIPALALALKNNNEIK